MGYTDWKIKSRQPAFRGRGVGCPREFDAPLNTPGALAAAGR